MVTSRVYDLPFQSYGHLKINPQIRTKRETTSPSPSHPTPPPTPTTLPPPHSSNHPLYIRPFVAMASTDRQCRRWNRISLLSESAITFLSRFWRGFRCLIHPKVIFVVFVSSRHCAEELFQEIYLKFVSSSRVIRGWSCSWRV